MFGASAEFLTDYYEYEHAHTKLQVEFPKLRVIPKAKVWWMPYLALLLKLLSFGRMISFMSQYTTTLGHTIYTPSNWEDQPFFSRAAILRHEGVHFRQREKMGFVTYALAYLFLPLPAVFAVGRRDMEMEAYEETLRAFAEYYGVQALRENHIRIRVTDEFLGPNYLWMWPFRKDIDRWYDEVVSRLEKSPTRNVHAEDRQHLSGKAM